MISTNADLAVSRNTNHVQTSKGQGTSGTRTDSAYATIKRVFYKTDKSDEKQDEDYPSEDGYLWRFKGLILRARINDDKVTGSEHNEMIDKIMSTPRSQPSTSNTKRTVLKHIGSATLMKKPS